MDSFEKEINGLDWDETEEEEKKQKSEFVFKDLEEEQGEQEEQKPKEESNRIRPFKLDDFVESLTDEDALKHAKDLGWKEKPVDRNGNPIEAKNPRDFLLGNSAAKNVSLSRGLIQDMSRQIAQMRAEQKIQELDSYKRGLEEGKRNLQEQHKGAVELGDYDKAQQVFKDQLELERREQELKIDYERSLSQINENQNSAEMSELEPIYNQFRLQNPWYNNDPTAREFTNNLMLQFSNAGNSPATSIRMAEMKMLSDFPHLAKISRSYFGGGVGRKPTDMGSRSGTISANTQVRREVKNLDRETRRTYENLIGDVSDPKEKANLTNIFLRALSADSFI